MMNMMETMLRNPEMQKMLYPYLPEPMRNPSSIEWMLSNPEVKKQMASMFEQQASHRGTETQAGGDNAAFHYSRNNVDRVLMLFGLKVFLNQIIFFFFSSPPSRLSVCRT